MEPAAMDSVSESNLNEFRIPSFIFQPELHVSDDGSSSPLPECPVLVFINSKSGGQLGGDLLLTYRSLLNEKQVYVALHVDFIWVRSMFHYFAF